MAKGSDQLDLEQRIREAADDDRATAAELLEIRRMLHANLLDRELERPCLDRYVIGERIGQGGMGVVFAARDPVLERDVAIKLVRPTLDAGGGRNFDHRLRSEASALAQLSHPNIVSVFDVGTFGPEAGGALSMESGGVFLVMERLAGTSLREWLAAKTRAADEIIPILLEAGRGLLAAHTVGITHGDVKPDNIMVEPGRRARVLDFGLARPVGSASEELELAGTPLYMDPARAGDLRSDQYAYCLTVLEALVGKSVVSFRERDALTRCARAGSLPSAALETLRPPLAAALARGLHDEPAQRWDTLQPILDALRPPTPERTRSWAPAWWTGAAATAVTIAWAWPTAEPDPCRNDPTLVASWNAEARASVEAALSATETAFADRTSRQVLDALDDYVQRWTRQHETSCSTGASRQERECLERARRGAAALVRKLREPSVQTLTLATSAVRALHDPAGCGGEDTGIPAPPVDANAALAVAEARAQLAEAETLGRLGDYAAARAAIERALEVATGAQHAPAVAETLLALGRVQDNLGEYDDAADTLAQAFFSARAAGYGHVAAKAASFLVWVAGVRQSDEAAASQWSRHAATQATIPGLPCNRGAVEQRFGRYVAAAAQYRACIEGLDETHPDRTAILSARDNYAGALFRSGDTAAALVEFAAVLEARVAFHGPEHPSVAHSHNNVGLAQLQLGSTTEALVHLEQAVAIAEAATGPEHPDVPRHLNSLGEALLANGQTEAAVVAMQRGLALRRRIFGDEHPDVAAALANLGMALVARGDLNDAVLRHREALQVLGDAFGDDHPRVASTRHNLGEALRLAGRLGEARREQAAALAIWESALGTDHAFVGLATAELGRVSMAEGDVAGARPELERAVGILAEANARAIDLAGARADLSRALWRAGGDPAHSCSVAKSALAEFSEAGRPAASEAASFELEVAEHCDLGAQSPI